MLAYAASRPVLVDRRPYPNAMLLIIGAHVAALALVMSAKMDLPGKILDHPIRVTLVPEPPLPPRHTQPFKQRTQQQAVRDDTVDPPRQQILTDQGTHTLDTSGDTDIKLPPIDMTPFKLPPVRLEPVRTGPQLLTPASELKPPYPVSKLDNGEEAVLQLKLTIDGDGRVVAVDPVGRTDPVFLEAARRYVVTHWRYKPATEDGHAVDSSAIITLHFQLDA